jgi:hypothetical protein
MPVRPSASPLLVVRDTEDPEIGHARLSVLLPQKGSGWMIEEVE